jgi:type II secretory pathway component GspD/PulD (secretin)
LYVKATEADLATIAAILQPLADKPSDQPAAESAGTMTMTFRVDPRVSSNELTNKLMAAGVKIPPTIFVKNGNGMLLVRGSKEQLALVNQVVLALNGNSANEIEAESKSFMQRFTPAENALPKTDEAATNLFTRQFKVDPQTFFYTLQKTGIDLGNATNSPALALQKFFSFLGVNFDSPAGKSVFYPEGRGMFLVKATAADLDVIESAVQLLNQTPPQLHLKARFLEVPKGTYQDLVLPNLLTNAAVKLATDTNVQPGLLSEEKFKLVLRALQSKPGVEVLGEPEVTTLSGRQIQMRATQLITVVTNIDLHIPLTETVATGPILDAVAYVLADGYTINLAAIPSLTEFLGYDQPTNATPPNAAAAGKMDARKILPDFRVRQAVAKVNLWDDQTVVIGGMTTSSVLVTKDKVPVLGDLPVMGGLFQSQRKTSVETELLVFITATIVDPAGNRVHSAGELPFAKEQAPVQPPPQIQKQAGGL